MQMLFLGTHIYSTLLFQLCSQTENFPAFNVLILLSSYHATIHWAQGDKECMCLHVF